ncbi:hypothetical protein BDM02DRAFT_3192562 [Thelephora ganbajun]|uniref:Uncharacterized protein n=1 Tax=Thelephora ganbajun TaxID=370292 RepID=A0ACB6YZZ5_THEGA|nr:hypothetical protein BDM02DRAFT_3192562 [Thelephora ganbajun]
MPCRVFQSYGSFNDQVWQQCISSLRNIDENRRSRMMYDDEHVLCELIERGLVDLSSSEDVAICSIIRYTAVVGERLWSLLESQQAMVLFGGPAPGVAPVYLPTQVRSAPPPEDDPSMHVVNAFNVIVTSILSISKKDPRIKIGNVSTVCDGKYRDFDKALVSKAVVDNPNVLSQTPISPSISPAPISTSTLSNLVLSTPFSDGPQGLLLA